MKGGRKYALGSSDIDDMLYFLFFYTKMNPNSGIDRSLNNSLLFVCVRVYHSSQVSYGSQALLLTQKSSLGSI